MKLKATKDHDWKDAIQLLGEQYGVDFDQVTGFRVMINFDQKYMELIRPNGQAKLEIDLSELDLYTGKTLSISHEGFYNTPLSLIPCLGLCLDKDGDMFDINLLVPDPQITNFPLRNLSLGEQNV